MKKSLSLFLSCLAVHSVQAQVLTQADIATTCSILVRLTNEALANKQLDKVVVYYNTFQVMEPQALVPDKYKKWFSSTISANAPVLSEWTLMTNGNKPKLAKGFRNLEGDINIKTTIIEAPKQEE